MTPLDVSTILGNKTRPWFHVCQLSIDRQAAADFFDVDAVVADEPGLGDGDYWAVKFDCGLKLAFEFFHWGKGGSVFADLPCSQHARRHLRHWDSELVDVPRDMQEPDRGAMIERFAGEMPELLELDAFQVWRQGDDGNQVKIGMPTTKRDADCWVAELESHHHKQIYWVSRASALQRDA
ncbi:hypothetical protein [Planctomycetes bacterium TBK1r]|uniref:hypothetical protein n=1 Tax=Stieleria magnilauensis TaxID=2527963 RepID=UPI0011A27933